MSCHKNDKPALRPPPPPSRIPQPEALADSGAPLEQIVTAILLRILLREYRKQHRAVKPPPSPRKPPKPKLTQEERDFQRLQSILHPPPRGMATLKRTLRKPNDEDPFWFLPEELRPVAQNHWDRLLARHAHRLDSVFNLRNLLKANAVFLAKHPEVHDRKFSHHRWHTKWRNTQWLRKYMKKRNAALSHKITLDQILEEQKMGFDPIGSRLMGV